MACSGWKKHLDGLEFDNFKYCPYCGAELDDKGCSYNRSTIPYDEIVSYLNERLGTRYRSSTAKTRKMIKARWNEGFRLQDFKDVIDKKAVEWIGNKEMEKYLRPVTLFSTKFESYLNQISVSGNRGKGKAQRLQELYGELEDGEETDF